MADDSTQPGVPTPQAADKASDGVAEKSMSAPHNALSTLKQMDRLILRLNKLLSTPGGLSASLSTLNYVLYILTYLQPKIPSPAHLASKLLSTSSKALIKTLVNDPSTVPPVAALAGLLSKCRTTLRLFAAFPLYAWLRTLLVDGPKPGNDQVLHRIATLQASSYLVYQALENVCLLADCGAVPSSFIARINRGDGATARLYLYAYRAWLGGVSCDFLRLAREAQLVSRRREARRKLKEDGHEVAYDQDEEDAQVDKKWWADLMIACAWLPMALHYSSSTGGLPGWNLGWMGVCGLVAGGQRFKGLWEATA
ncbi:hypothetical protein P280DRAFT_413114 [Massarina eburnea CBS 473.64]|uniref:Peroxin 11C n=1 Tax=Massarina eburnea CBS 473.64 TaxID=1395130 RepID=A0A6A6RH54_9PLEO|nr:hypothetical protein P280DRAFT_413114 [Massarina eburnea CBS 473.64]